ncbi:MAG: hypothetical protein H6602_01060 [Flavobacteriales bacterium]|nr:hypothetical protein [Flavobacteriales bacterium]
MKYPSSAIARDFEKIDWFGYYFGSRNFYALESERFVRGGARGRAEMLI